MSTTERPGAERPTSDRVRAERLVLVNWRGVFFAELALDRHVTALEGDNGAGKTTALIATYVVLLPDLTRLRFTNMGEGEATGGDRGIWGRLGEPGRPAYAWVAFEGDPEGDRPLFGVLLRKGGEPNVELTHLCIRGLPRDAKLQDTLLHRDLVSQSDTVPELEELKVAVAAQGGRLEVFGSAKEYFAALFDVGVTPLRLTEGDARARFNEVLRTSMTGGLSRGLTRDLRRFVLEAEDGLGTTLRRMNENLDACHRSRVEVEHARRLQKEIGEVHAAGHAMFAGSMRAARLAAEAAGRRYTEQIEKVERLRQSAESHAEQDVTLAARAEFVHAELVDARSAFERARQHRDKVREAAGAVEALARLEAELPGIEAQVALTAQARLLAEANLEEARARRTERRRALDEATRGLHDAQSGLEGLQLRAARHARAQRSLEMARTALERPELQPAEANRVLAEVDARRAETDLRRRNLRREIDTAAQRRSEFERTLAALQSALPAGRPAVSPDAAHAVASTLLQEARSHENLLAQLPHLQREVRSLTHLADRRTRLLDRLATRFDEATRPKSTTDLEALLSAADAEFAAANEAAQLCERALTEAQRRVPEARAKAQAAQRRAAQHAELLRAARALAEPEDREIHTGADLLALHEHLEAKAAELARSLDAVQAQVRALEVTLDGLSDTGGGLPADLLRAAEAVDGSPLRARFDDVAVEEAATVEARLGPLVDAVVVDDPYEAAEAWPLDGPRHAWLIDHATARELVRTGGGKSESEGAAGVFTQHGEAWRLSRLPADPVVGRAARKARREGMEHERSALAQQADDLRREHAEALAARRRCSPLLGQAELLDGPDPQQALREAEHGLTEAEEAVGDARERQAEAADTERLARSRHELLRALGPDAPLLDEPDPRPALERAVASLAQADIAREWLSHGGPARAKVEAGLEVLRWPPPPPEALAGLEEDLAAADEARDRLDAADEALRALSEVRDALEDHAAATELAELKLGHADAHRRVAEAREAESLSERAVEKAETSLSDARTHAQRAEVQADTHGARLAERQAALVALGLGRPDAETRSESEAAVGRAELKVTRLQESEIEISGDRRAVAVRLEQLRADQRRTDADAREAEGLYRPQRDRWQALRMRMSDENLLDPTLTEEASGTPEGGRLRDAETMARDEARTQRARLVERLRRAREGADVANHLEAIETSPEGDLQAWLLTRVWLRRCLPARLAETPDPRVGLERLSGHLDALQARLIHQEQILAGSAGDVAHFVRQLRRRAKRQIERLNDLLAPISFGSIAGMRLEMAEIKEMELLLDGLDHQGDLFKPGVPIDQALDELFARVGGRGGSERLLDYREYFDLTVRVRRRSEEHWTLANPTRMSTGEAIGVGAALMMVVLHAWEDQNRLSRKLGDRGTLRLLFLDEANRLSADNLGVLFELCRSLDLQLLIAAPRVDEATGNTTYRLTRMAHTDGREEVRFSGRRLRHNSPPRAALPLLPEAEAHPALPDLG